MSLKWRKCRHSRVSHIYRDPKLCVCVCVCVAAINTTVSRTIGVCSSRMWNVTELSAFTLPVCSFVVAPMVSITTFVPFYPHQSNLNRYIQGNQCTEVLHADDTWLTGNYADIIPLLLAEIRRESQYVIEVNLDTGLDTCISLTPKVAIASTLACSVATDLGTQETRGQEKETRTTSQIA